MLILQNHSYAIVGPTLSGFGLVQMLMPKDVMGCKHLPGLSPSGYVDRRPLFTRLVNI